MCECNVIYVIWIYNLLVSCAGILKCLVPCIRHTPGRSRSPSPERIIKENETQENRKEVRKMWMWKFFMCSLPLRESKCSCSCVSQRVASMYGNIVIGPFSSVVVCNQCDQIVTKVICLMFYVEWFLHGVVADRLLYPFTDIIQMGSSLYWVPDAIWSSAGVSQLLGNVTWRGEILERNVGKYHV